MKTGEAKSYEEQIAELEFQLAQAEVNILNAKIALQRACKKKSILSFQLRNLRKAKA